ncbi:MAG: hypothetical protein HY855_17375 [Burkholderiales bacterium]|nr:hypothetical protein [Burkholderiales bacterium]
MGLRAFVARSGWEKNPISAEEWWDAVATMPELSVHLGREGEPAFALLRGSQRRRVSWRQGFLCGDHVDRRLITVLFLLADRLGAQVFSEHRRVYRDLADWERRVQRRSTPGRQARMAGAPPGARQGMAAHHGRAAGLEPVLAGLVLLAMLVIFALQ